VLDEIMINLRLPFDKGKSRLINQFHPNTLLPYGPNIFFQRNFFTQYFDSDNRQTFICTITLYLFGTCVCQSIGTVYLYKNI